MIIDRFEIVNGRIYDLESHSFFLKKRIINNTISYYVLKENKRRLFKAEPLLCLIDSKSTYLKIKNIKTENKIMKTNTSVLYNLATLEVYPPSKLMPRKFSLYKRIKRLKRLHLEKNTY